MNWPCTDGIVDSQFIEQQDSENYQHSCDSSNQDRLVVAHAVAAGSNADQTSEDAIETHREIGLPEDQPTEQRGNKSTRSRGEGRGHGTMHSPINAFRPLKSQHAARVKSVPPKPRNETSQCGEGHIMTGHGDGFSIHVATQAGTEN